MANQGNQTSTQKGAQDQGAVIDGSKNTVNTGTQNQTTVNTNTGPNVSGTANVINNTGIQPDSLALLFKSILPTPAPTPTPTNAPAATYTAEASGSADSSPVSVAATPGSTLATVPVAATPSAGWFGSLSKWQLAAAIAAVIGTIYLIATNWNSKKKAA